MKTPFFPKDFLFLQNKNKFHKTKLEHLDYKVETKQTNGTPQKQIVWKKKKVCQTNFSNRKK